MYAQSAIDRLRSEMDALYAPDDPEATYYEAIGAEIRRLREARNWTQLRLAVDLGLESSVAVHYWETARNHPSAWQIERLERLFGERVRP